MATLVNGELLAEGEIPQGQTATSLKIETSVEMKRDKAWIIVATQAGMRREVQCLLKIGILSRHRQ
jgi:hypothetical protein